MVHFYDVAKTLKQHALLIKKHAYSDYVCTCKPESLEPCEGCDLNSLFRDLAYFADELRRV